MKKVWLFPVLIFLFLSTSMHTMASSPIGFVKSVTGEVTIVSGDLARHAVDNMKFFVGDSISTSSNSGVGLIFADDTVVSLGPESKMVVQDFHFSPSENKLSFIAKILNGTFSFITGQIAKLAPQKVKIETPDATLGVRGTKFLVKID